MSEKTELLNFIYKNADMGETAMPLVIGMVTRPDLRMVLCGCLMDYRAVGGAAKETLQRCGHCQEAPGVMKKAMMKTVLHWNAVLSPPPRHIAEMMIRGSTMGAIQVGKRINAYRYTAGEEALMLAERLLKVEEDTIERMNGFL